MAEALSIERQRELLHQIVRLAADRAAAETRIRARLSADSDAVMHEYQSARDRLAAARARERSAIETEYRSACETVAAQYESARAAAQTQFDQIRARIRADFEAGVQTAGQTQSEARWEAVAVFEAGKNTAVKERQAELKRLEATSAAMQEIRHVGEQLYAERGPSRDTSAPTPSAPDARGDGLPHLDQSVAEARDRLQAFHDRRIPKMFQGATPLVALAAAWLITATPTAVLLGWDSWHWLAATTASTLAVCAALGAWLYPVAKRQTRDDFAALVRSLANAEAAIRAARERTEANCRQRLAHLSRQQDDELTRADERFAHVRAELTRQMEDRLKKADATYPPRLKEAAARRDQERTKIETWNTETGRELESRHGDQAVQLAASYESQMSAGQRQARQEWDAMAETWRTGVAQFEAEIDRMNDACARRFVPWQAVPWRDWKPPAQTPPAIPFGTIAVDMRRIDGGIPHAEELRSPRTVHSMPALLPFPERPSLLLHTRGEGRRQAIPVMHNVMLRMLTSIPPGRLQLTIIDPLGLGENFAAFMHLADYDEQLVTRRIWTESGDIERRLADLSEHMENVIQKYLRNEFESIGQYNAQAGEVAEPFRVLVVADFPANFTETAAHRLMRLASGGTRCGIFTLVGIDRERELPARFELGKLEPHATNLVWSNGRFVWKDATFSQLPLRLDDPPQGSLLTDIMRAVGAKGRDANRVEVPFRLVAPNEGTWWSEDSGSQLSVPLGRAGATDLLCLQLGKGTSQHVLISGKTGAGKSTLLHVLVTNLALRYGPDQVEFYLVDFKKGVEFKPYARYRLPHARVIAIESEREFGLSVLERLDAELKERGDRFRTLGVQDLKGFRAAVPAARMPRILLVIDEFQELFVEDDKIAQSASLHLDRLVRQGRAFGIHTLLGSQTLAGAYSLARSTIGQMAVRIALQCGETDAHLILSEDNTAARLLRRPGQAIYNDGNGMPQDNHLFQVAWLDDSEREAALMRLERYAAEQGVPTEPAIVFEGNLPADAEQNSTLANVLAAPIRPDPGYAARAWLGAAVAIKEPTSVTFRRQSGNNLLIVGQQEEAALGMLATCLVSLAAQYAPRGTQPERQGTPFVMLNGAAPDAWQTGWLQDFLDVLPHGLALVDPLGAAQTIADVAAELARRQNSATDDAAPMYLLIYNLARFRNLRRAEDDFGLPSFAEGEQKSTAQQFGVVLTEGPSLGIHTLMWCDSSNNVHRYLTRQMLRDVEMRVLFQISEADSTSLIDTPVAGRLGQHRAILYSAEHGTLEKFRPYGPPSRKWLDAVRDNLHRHAIASR